MFGFDLSPRDLKLTVACHSLTCMIILNPQRRQRRAQRKIGRGKCFFLFFFICLLFFVCLGFFEGGVSGRRQLWGDKIDEKRRQNLEEAEEVATGKFGCEMKVEKRRRKGRSVLGRGG